MAKLPVLWVGKFQLSIVNASTVCAQIWVKKESDGSNFEYIPAKRCKTCVSWSASHCYGDVPGADELAGDGFCHNHEERI